MFYRIFILSLALLFGSFSQSFATEYFINGRSSPVDVATSPALDRKMITPYSDSYDLFTDQAHGYKILIPKNSSVDISFSAICTTFTTPNLKVEIYYDDLTNKPGNFYELITYSNMFLRRGGPHTITANYSTGIDGYSAHTTKWQRDKLARIPNDRNFYMSTSVQRTSQKIYTIMLKSSSPLGSTGDTITNSFSFISPSGNFRNYKHFYQSTSPMNEQTQKVFDELFGPEANLTWGIFEYSAPQNFNKLHDIEKNLDHRFKVLLRYQTIDEPLPLTQLERAWENDRIVELTLATIHNTQANALWVNGVPPNALTAYRILNGEYDEYFTNYAHSLKQFGKPIIFRLNNEMNGDWCWYSAFYTARDSDIYKELWYYIRGIFDREGVDNLIWVWNPHDVSLPNFSWNHSLAYYPGDKYVDVVGMTGYNNGTYFAGEKWRTFSQIYQELYGEYIDLFDKPFMLTEFSSNSIGGNKAAWIDDMFNQIEKYPNIKVAVWWNGVDYDKNNNPGRIYLIDDSPEVIEAMKNGLAKYQSKVHYEPPKDEIETMGSILRPNKIEEQDKK